MRSSLYECSKGLLQGCVHSSKLRCEVHATFDYPFKVLLSPLPPGHDPCLLEPLDAAREGARVEAVLPQEEAVLRRQTRLSPHRVRPLAAELAPRHLPAMIQVGISEFRKILNIFQFKCLKEV